MKLIKLKEICIYGRSIIRDVLKKILNENCIDRWSIDKYPNSPIIGWTLYYEKIYCKLINTHAIKEYIL